MKYAVQIVDDADSNIFEGLQALTPESCPPPWSKELDDDSLEASGVFSRDALNARLEMEVDCWECRLA